MKSVAHVFLSSVALLAHSANRKNTDKLLAAAAGSALLDQQLLQLPIVNGVTQAALNLIMTQWDTKEGTWFCVTAAAGLGAKLVTVLKTVTDNPPFVAQVCTLICRLAEPSQQIGYRMALDKQGALPLLLARIETGGLDGGAQSELCGAAAAFAAMVSSCSQINASALKAEAVEKITKRLRDLSAPGVATTDAALHSLIACLVRKTEEMPMRLLWAWAWACPSPPSSTESAPAASSQKGNRRIQYLALLLSDPPAPPPLPPSPYQPPRSSRWPSASPRTRSSWPSTLPPRASRRRRGKRLGTRPRGWCACSCDCSCDCRTPPLLCTAIPLSNPHSLPSAQAARMLFASAFHGEGLEEADAAIAAAGGKGATAKHPAAILAEALTRADAPEDPNGALGRGLLRCRRTRN